MIMILVQNHAMVGATTNSALGFMYTAFLQAIRHRFIFKSNSSADFYESGNKYSSGRRCQILFN